MSALNGIETALDNFPAPNQEMETKEYKTSECRLPPSYFSQLKLDFILTSPVKLKVLFTQVLNSIETVFFPSP